MQHKALCQVAQATEGCMDSLHSDPAWLPYRPYVRADFAAARENRGCASYLRALAGRRQ